MSAAELDGLARLGPSLAAQATLELQPGLRDLLSRTEEELSTLGSKQIIFEAQIARAENLSKKIAAAELEIGLQEKKQLALENEEKVKDRVEVKDPNLGNKIDIKF